MEGSCGEGEQQRRQDSDHGYFPGGSMDSFKAGVLAAPVEHLQAWEEQLEERDIQPPACPNPFLFCFVTDHDMLPEQHARLRVLSLAGHPMHPAWCSLTGFSRGPSMAARPPSSATGEAAGELGEVGSAAWSR